MTVAVPDELLQRIEAVKPKDVPMDGIVLLISNYAANKPTAEGGSDSDWVVLPANNFDAYYGSSPFSRKYLPKISERFIEKKPQSYGISKYRVCERDCERDRVNNPKKQLNYQRKKLLSTLIAPNN